MPTSVLTLGSSASNYDDLRSGIKSRLSDPDPRTGGDPWSLSGKTAARVNNLTVKNTDNDVEIGIAARISNFRNLDFQIVNSAERSVTVDRSIIASSNFIAKGEGKETLVFGGQATARRVSVSLGDNDDYLEFRNKTGSGGARSYNGSYEMGDGSDSVVFQSKSKSSDDTLELGEGVDTVMFAAGARATDIIVDLGDDSDVDRVEIKTLPNGKEYVSGVINNFGDNDILVIGGDEYDKADIVAAYNSEDDAERLFLGNIRVNLQNPE